MSSRALLQKAQNFLGQNQPHAAWQLLKNDELSASNADLLYFRAIAATECGEVSDAQQSLTSCLAIMPSHPGAHFQRGLLALNQGDQQQAVSHFQTATGHAPGWAEAYYNLGVVQAALGDVAAAETSYRAALKAAPKMAQAANNLANLILARGDHKQAAGLLEQVVAHYPDFAEGWCSHGRALMVTQKLDEAAQALERALTLREHFPAAWENLGDVRKQQGRIEDALQAFDRALEQDPGNERLEFKRALVRGDSPQRPPDGYVRDLFDNMANTFETHLVQGLGYRLPFELESHLQGVLTAVDTLDVLDLGCGSGLAGMHLKPWAKRLVGVDLSPRILQVAATREIYDELIEAPLQDVLAGSDDNSWDLVVATDVFVYVGDLRGVLAEVRRVLRLGGHLLFSAELSDDDSDFVLQATGRYAHSRTGLRADLEALGFAVEVDETLPLRRESGEMLQGVVIRARRT